MRNRLKFQIILWISFFALIPLNIRAQKAFIPEQDLENHAASSAMFEKDVFQYGNIFVHIDLREVRMSEFQCRPVSLERISVEKLDAARFVPANAGDGLSAGTLRKVFDVLEVYKIVAVPLR